MLGVVCVVSVQIEKGQFSRRKVRFFKLGKLSNGNGAGSVPELPVRSSEKTSFGWINLCHCEEFNPESTVDFIHIHKYNGEQNLYTLWLSRSVSDEGKSGFRSTSACEEDSCEVDEESRISRTAMSSSRLD